MLKSEPGQIFQYRGLQATPLILWVVPRLTNTIPRKLKNGPLDLRDFGRGERGNELFSKEWVDGVLTTVFLLLIQHWFPWPRKLHRLETYALGVGAILVGVWVWMSRAGQIEQWVELFVFCVISGAAVCGSYLLDWLLKQRAVAKFDKANGRD